MSQATLGAVVGTYVLLFPLGAQAYLDPGSGSMLLYFLVGFFAAVANAVKDFGHRIGTFLMRLTNGGRTPELNAEIVMHSEGAHYWNVSR